MINNAIRRISASGMATTVAIRSVHTTGTTTAATNPIPNDAHGLSRTVVTTDWWNLGRKRTERRPRIKVQTKLADNRRSQANIAAGKSRGLGGETFLTIFPLIRAPSLTRAS